MSTPLVLGFSPAWMLVLWHLLTAGIRTLKFSGALEVCSAVTFCKFYDGMDAKNVYCTWLLFFYVKIASDHPWPTASNVSAVEQKVL